MKYVSKKPEDWDMEYENKFGILKKANILFSFRRYPDALKIVDEAVKKINIEQKEKDEKFADLDRKWRAKLQISDHILPKEILGYNITQEVLDYFNIKIPLATLLVYVEKMRKGNSFSMYNRHTYLNNQIQIFYELVMKTINKFKVDIRNMTKQLNEINLWEEKKENLKHEDKNLYKKFSNNYKNKICPSVKEGKKCDKNYRKCNFAHSAVQLNLTKIESNKKLLKNNIKETKEKIKETKTPIAWNYPKEGVYEKGRVFDKLLVKRNSTFKVKRAKSAKRLESVDIAKMRIRAHEI
jgi:prefoldin subunit 5